MYLVASTFQVRLDIFFEILIKVNVMEYTRELVNVVRVAFLQTGNIQTQFVYRNYKICLDFC